MDNRWVVQVSRQDLLCKSGCGYYGNPQWKGFCSKCWRLQLKQSRSRNGDYVDLHSQDEVSGHQSARNDSSKASRVWPTFTLDRFLDPMWNTVPRGTSFRSILRGGPNTESAAVSSAPINVTANRRSMERQLSEESLQAKQQLLRFLDTIPKGVAQMIAKQTKAMTNNILTGNLNLPLDDISEIIQDFYTSISSRLNNQLKDSPNLAEQILEEVEGYICCRCYNSLFWSDSDEEVADISFQDRIRSLHWVTCGPLDPGFDLSKAAVLDNYEKAIGEIIATNIHRRPTGKLEALTRCCQLIFQCLKDSHDSLASADEFLPALIYVILRANPPLILSNIKFISRFALPAKVMSGEAGYYFTNLCCALNFIQNINAESLKMHPDEFEAYSCGHLVPPIGESSIYERKAVETIEKSLNELEEIQNNTRKLLAKADQLKEMIKNSMDECHSQINRSRQSFVYSGGDASSSDVLLIDKCIEDDSALPCALMPETISETTATQNQSTNDEQ